jgi:ribosome-associated toxin RatA of RatAB toxin-antitoxin module
MTIWSSWLAKFPGLAALALLTLAARFGAAFGAEQVSVVASRRDTAVEIKASATIKAPYELIWRTLTDYDHLSEFVPGMTTSHVVERHGATAIVEQTGHARFLFFSYPIEVLVESHEKPPYLIGMRIVKGNLKQLDGGYRIERTGYNDDEFVLCWSGIIERPSALPLFITVPLLRSNIADQFHGMIREIERREAVRMLRQAALQGLL